MTDDMGIRGEATGHSTVAVDPELVAAFRDWALNRAPSDGRRVRDNAWRYPGDRRSAHEPHTRKLNVA